MPGPQPDLLTPYHRALLYERRAADQPRYADGLHADRTPARGGIDTDRLRAIVADGPADALLKDMPEASGMVNATGLGKDQPGSPLSPDARFPRRAVVWELNYRGSLEFLHTGRAQAAARGVDGPGFTGSLRCGHQRAGPGAARRGAARSLGPFARAWRGVGGSRGARTGLCGGP